MFSSVVAQLEEQKLMLLLAHIRSTLPEDCPAFEDEPEDLVKATEEFTENHGKNLSFKHGAFKILQSLVSKFSSLGVKTLQSLCPKISLHLF